MRFGETTVIRSRVPRAFAAGLVLGISLAAQGDSSSISAANASVTVTGSSSETLNFPITRSGDLSFAANFSYSTPSGSAVEDVDYSHDISVAVIPAGASSVMVPITIAGNTSNPPDKTFTLKLDLGFGYGPASSYASAQTLPAGDVPHAVAAVDLSGDGKPDLVAANAFDDNISVWFNTTVPGAATATFTAPLSFGTGASPAALAIADFNRDGSLDVAVANRGSANASVLLNASAGGVSPSFAPHQAFATGAQPDGVAAADLNGDGNIDLAVANFNDSTVSVLLNTTAPGAAAVTFTAQQAFATADEATSVAAADINGDGRPELVVTNHTASSVSILRNTTAPGASAASFAAAQSFGTSPIAMQVVPTDLTGDGKLDLVVTSLSSNKVSLLVNTTPAGATTLTFAPNWPFFDVGDVPEWAAVADVNGDGKPDVITSNRFGQSVSVLTNSSFPAAFLPHFEEQQTYALGSSGPGAIAAADFNLDGRPDIVVADPFDDTLALLLNTTGVGVVDARMGTAQLFGGGAGGGADGADLNGDGKPDLVVADQGSNRVLALRNTTVIGTTASFAAQQAFATGVAPRMVQTTDLNSDGRPDLAVANQGATTISTLLNTTPTGNATLAFATHQEFQVGESAVALAALDVNTDGRPDLAVSNQTTDNVSVLLNTTAPGAATASFAAQKTFAVGNLPRRIAAGDLNADGLSDLVVVNELDDTLSVLINDTAPGAALAAFLAQAVVATGNAPVAVAIADLNNDGKPDLLVANQADDTISILRNTTTQGADVPSFAAPQNIASGDHPEALGAADFDGDGRLDVLLTNGIDSTAQFILNATAPGSTSFAFGDSQASGPLYSGDSVQALDVNGDDRPDLVVGTGLSAAVLPNLQFAVTLGAPTTGTIHYAYVPPPPAPTNLVAVPDDQSVFLNWTASPGATSYNIYMALAPGVPGDTPYATSSADSGTLAFLSNGTRYYFVVRAVGPGGLSGLSNEVSVVPAAEAGGGGGGAWGGLSLLVLLIAAVRRYLNAARSSSGLNTPPPPLPLANS